MSSSELQRIDGSGLRFHLSGRTEQPSSLVFLLHGSGSHGGNLLSLATRLAVALPETLFVLPNAPQSTRELLSSEQVAATERDRPGINWDETRNWVRSEPGSADKAAQRQAFLDMIHPPARGLCRLADLLLARHALPGSAFAIYGFSQGGMMAMYVAVDRDPACAGVICHSGQFLGGTQPRSRPRTLLIVGEQELGPSRAMSMVYPLVVKAVRAIDAPLEEYVAPGLDHGFDAGVVGRIGAFLAAVLAARETAADVP